MSRSSFSIHARALVWTLALLSPLATTVAQTPAPPLAKPIAKVDTIHGDVMAGRLSAAPLVDPVPVRRLVLAYLADRPATRLARFAGDTIEKIATDLIGRGIWSGKLLVGEPETDKIPA